MSSIFVVSAVFCLTGQLIRLVYEIQKKNQKIDPSNQAIFYTVFAGMCLFLISWIFMCPADPMRILMPDVFQWLGLIVAGLGLILAFGGMIQLRGVENIDHLVTTGIFSKIRHPMYTGFICWILGWLIYSGGVVSGIIGLMSMANVLFWRKLEEDKLEIDYGDVYVKYQERTWF